MPLDRSALDAGTEAVVDGGTTTDSDDQWGPWVPIVPVMVPSVSAAPDARYPQIQMHQLSPQFHRYPQIQMHQLSPRFPRYPSTNPDAPAIATVPSVSTAIDAPATSPVPLLVTMPSAGSSMGPPAVAVPQIKYAARPGEGRLLDYASSWRLVSMSAPDFGEGHMVPLPRARLLLLLEVHQILVGLSRSRLGTNFRQHRQAVYHRKNMQL